jgi:hypothetical protein
MNLTSHRTLPAWRVLHVSEFCGPTGSVTFSIFLYKSRDLIDFLVNCIEFLPKLDTNFCSEGTESEFVRFSALDDFPLCHFQGVRFDQSAQVIP